MSVEKLLADIIKRVEILEAAAHLMEAPKTDQLDSVKKRMTEYIRRAYLDFKQPIYMRDMTRKYSRACMRFGTVHQVLRELEKAGNIVVIQMADTIQVIYLAEFYNKFDAETKNLLQLPKERRNQIVADHRAILNQIPTKQSDYERFDALRIKLLNEKLRSGMDETDASLEAAEQAQNEIYGPQ